MSCPKCGDTGIYWTDENGCVISYPIRGSIKQACSCSWSDVKPRETAGQHMNRLEDSYDEIQTLKSKLTRADTLAEYSDIIDKWFDVDGNATSSPPRSAVLKFRAALAAYREE